MNLKILLISFIFSLLPFLKKRNNLNLISFNILSSFITIILILLRIKFNIITINFNYYSLINITIISLLTLTYNNLLYELLKTNDINTTIIRIRSLELIFNYLISLMITYEFNIKNLFSTIFIIIGLLLNNN